MKEQKNIYTAYGRFYDDIVLTGYYNHDIFAIILLNLLGKRKKIFDLGIGSGLLTEKMLQLKNYDITGIDFSPIMLNKVRKRLKHTTVKLIQEDFSNYHTSETFDAIVSTGGSISITYRKKEKQHRLFSYADDKAEHISLMKRLYAMLNHDGLLLIAIQDEHIDTVTTLRSGVIYEQKVRFEKSYLRKTYNFYKDDELIDYQTIQTVYFDEQEFNQVFLDVGFSFAGIDDSNNFFVYRKK